MTKYDNHKFAIFDKSTNKPSEWVDLFSFEVQDYNIDIATELAKKGFDEINFDYIRFQDNNYGFNKIGVYQFEKFFKFNPKDIINNYQNKFELD